jgi:hypothetical protein
MRAAWPGHLRRDAIVLLVGVILPATVVWRLSQDTLLLQDSDPAQVIEPSVSSAGSIPLTAIRAGDEGDRRGGAYWGLPMLLGGLPRHAQACADVGPGAAVAEAGDGAGDRCLDRDLPLIAVGFGLCKRCGGSRHVPAQGPAIRPARVRARSGRQGQRLELASLFSRTYSSANLIHLPNLAQLVRPRVALLILVRDARGSSGSGLAR